MIPVAARPIAKTLLGHMLWHPLTRPLSQRTLGRDVGLIYTFHYIGEPVIPGVCPSLFLSKEAFSQVLDFISQSMTPLAPTDFLDRLQQGTLPPRAVMLTFDDCTRDSYTVAMPELEKRNLKACFFVCPGLVNQSRTIPCLELMDICAQAPAGTYDLNLPIHTRGEARVEETGVTVGDSSRAKVYQMLWPHLYRCSSSLQGTFLGTLRDQLGLTAPAPHSYPLTGWDELTEMHRKGMWIANHTMHHSTCQADTLGDFADEVSSAFDALRTRFPSEQRLFCYPYGSTLDVSSETTRLLADLRTDIALVTQGGAARLTRDGPLRLHREDVTYSAGAAKLAPLWATLR